MKIIYDPRHRRHQPQTEILYGKPLVHPERPERVEAVRQALEGTPWAGAVMAPRDYPLVLAERIHEPAYLLHLQERCAEAGAVGPREEWFPYVWPRDRGMDTGTPLQGETLELAWGAASCALTAADLLSEGESGAYALCRPPGHHAAPGAMGGYCYFNNAALAADRLLASTTPAPDASTLGGSSSGRAAPGRLGRPAAARGVAILDLDIHHGNGTQDIFYATDRVLYCSIHGEPEWGYPPHTGFGEETGTGAGQGFTQNQPLPEGTDWPVYAAALDRALESIARFDPRYVVLSQGYDTFEGDRWGGFLLHAEHFTQIGERVRALGRPVLVLLEGGYEPANIAAGSLALLDGLA